MSARRLAGAQLSAGIRAEVASVAAAAGRAPRLAIVTAADDEASAWYVRSIAAAAGKVGVDCDVELLAAVGPVTTALLLRNSVIAHAARNH